MLFYVFIINFLLHACTCYFLGSCILKHISKRIEFHSRCFFTAHNPHVPTDKEAPLLQIGENLRVSRRFHQLHPPIDTFCLSASLKFLSGRGTPRYTIYIHTYIYVCMYIYIYRSYRGCVSVGSGLYEGKLG